VNNLEIKFIENKHIDKIFRENVNKIFQLRNILIIGGSYYHHAPPIISSLACLRVGTSSLYIMVPKPLTIPLRSYILDATIIPLPDQKITKGVTNKIIKLLRGGKVKAEAVLLGPGITGVIKEVGILTHKIVQMNIPVILTEDVLKSDILKYINNALITLILNSNVLRKVFNISIDKRNLNESVKDVTKLSEKFQGLSISSINRLTIISSDDVVYIYRMPKYVLINKISRYIIAGLATNFIAKNIPILDSLILAVHTYCKCCENMYVKYGLHYTARDLISAISTVVSALEKEYGVDTGK